MSLILEALKKSEAERRLGRAPDLLTPAAMPVPERRPWLWLWGVVFGLAAALIVVLVLWARSALDAPTARPPAPASASAPAALPPDATMSAPPPAHSPAPVPRTPAEAIANAPLPQDQAFTSTERESVPVPAHAIPLPPPAPPTPRQNTPSPPAQAQPVVTRPLPASLPAAASVPVTAPEPEPAPTLEPLQHLATLPASLREGLPPLRLSMHVYDPDPAARFVLIDGKRYRQGDAIAPGILVDAIRPDGVAIAHGQQRFLLSRP